MEIFFSMELFSPVKTSLFAMSRLVSDFWARIDNEFITHFSNGRVVSVFAFNRNDSSWEDKIAPDEPM